MTGETAVGDPLYDPLSPEAIADPYPFYWRLREQNPVYWHRMLDSWVVTGYDECRRVLGDPERFASDFRRVGVDIPAAQLSLQALDPPEHGKIRHLLVSALHEQPAAAMARQVDMIADERVSMLPVRGDTADLVSEFARPVALRTICDFLGVARPAGSSFEAMSNAIVRSMDAGIEPDRAEPGNRARAELSQIIADWLRAATDDDVNVAFNGGFIGAAKRAHRCEPDVSDALLANSMRAVLHAGYESVSRLIGNVLARLVARPDVLTDAAFHHDLPPLVDELIRLDGPVQADARVCVSETTLGQERIARGEVVVLFIAAANRDPRTFVDPDEVRTTRRGAPHLAFGRGAHACLGARLGTLQLTAVLKALRGAGVSFAAAGPTVYDSTATLRGPRSIPVSVHRPASTDEESG